MFLNLIRTGGSCEEKTDKNKGNKNSAESLIKYYQIKRRLFWRKGDCKKGKQRISRCLPFIFGLK